jgi:hypothetical protein
VRFNQLTVARSPLLLLLLHGHGMSAKFPDLLQQIVIHLLQEYQRLTDDVPVTNRPLTKL